MRSSFASSMSWLPNQIGPFKISAVEFHDTSIKIELSNLCGIVTQQTMISLNLNFLWAVSFKESLGNSEFRIGGTRSLSCLNLISIDAYGNPTASFISDTVHLCMRGMLLLQLAKVVYNGEKGINRRFKPIQF